MARPITLEDRKRISELYAEGACVNTIAALCDRLPYIVKRVLASYINGATPREKPKRGTDRHEWAFARAGWPKYEDRKGLR